MIEKIILESKQLSSCVDEECQSHQAPIKLDALQQPEI